MRSHLHQGASNDGLHGLELKDSDVASSCYQKSYPMGRPWTSSHGHDLIKEQATDACRALALGQHYDDYSDNQVEREESKEQKFLAAEKVISNQTIEKK
ncbi:hypothetical protein AJ78_03971 [Emergomyces pasteurianus Ep9510]|uniref:Uncharacterized protein n=1 Tax=Emergomyces pasteurianus Ep9510 TaxID=1447872 RepID=A0A1J9QI10_9EURO|nr:hypothetical protein AJ78_03971 [Emergomyces pasteurianus Ep9510]